jgi:hypothetical protein
MMALAAFALGGVCPAWAADDLAKYVYPLANATGATEPTFEVDFSEVADDEPLRLWLEKAKDIGQDWLPIIRRFLATNDWSPPPTIRLVFKQNLDAPAATAKSVIYVSVRHVRQHPDDFGMIIHELTHVVQNYPPGNPGWLVEGVADYIRYWKYEPEKPHRRVDAKASYKDGYGTTAGFLAWLVWRHDRRIVSRLDDALRHGRYNDGLLQEWIGKPVDELWLDYLKAQPN